MEVVLLFFLLLVVLLVLSKLVFGGKNLPPSPPSLPIIGHLHLFKKPLYRTLVNISNKYGPVLYLRFGSRPVLLVSSPSAVEECLVKNDIIFANRPHLVSGKHFGNGYTTLVWAPYGDHLRNLRRLATLEILSPSRLHASSDIRTEEVRSVIKVLVGDNKDEYQTVEMKSALFEMTLNIITRLVSGKRYHGKQAVRFRKIVSGVFSLSGCSNIIDFFPVLRWIRFKGVEAKMVTLKKQRDEFLQELVDEFRNKLREKPSSVNDEKKKLVFVEVLLSLQETEPDYYTDEMIRGLIWVLVQTGTDTSAGTIEWALSLLLNHPQVLKKAQAEIDAHVGNGRLLEEADISKLPYLQRIITETLRMYPAGPLLAPHESSKDCVVGGYNIPKGTMLMVNMWAIHHDPTLWEDPYKFRPERFDGLNPKGARDEFKLLPFGTGRRGCPGEGFAMHVVGIALGSLIQCFDWERVGEELVDMSEGTGLTLPKAQPLVTKCRPRLAMLKLLP